uniref:Uncharacterized protein n=1 Tax=Mycena chlorophos TaxID=658473 RepID=A0ABQ0MCS2_MYCCL|nr:predicted protein [Mycena chlorophos]
MVVLGDFGAKLAGSSTRTPSRSIRITRRALLLASAYLSAPANRLKVARKRQITAKRAKNSVSVCFSLKLFVLAPTSDDFLSLLRRGVADYLPDTERSSWSSMDRGAGASP